MLANGPGNLCQAFGIERSFNGIDVCGDALFVEDHGVQPGRDRGHDQGRCRLRWGLEKYAMAVLYRRSPRGVEALASPSLFFRQNTLEYLSQLTQGAT